MASVTQSRAAVPIAARGQHAGDSTPTTRQRIWTIASLPALAFPVGISIEAFVDAIGPYGLTATITGSSAPHPIPRTARPPRS